jgi:G3E family GTPase
VDALTGPATLLEHDEAVHQVAAADLLAISKLDLAPPDAAEALEVQLAAINPAAEVTALSPHGPVTAVSDALLAATLSHAALTRPTVHHDHLAHGRVGAVCLTTDSRWTGSPSRCGSRSCCTGTGATCCAARAS